MYSRKTKCIVKMFMKRSNCEIYGPCPGALAVGRGQYDYSMNKKPMGHIAHLRNSRYMYDKISLMR